MPSSQKAPSPPPSPTEGRGRCVAGLDPIDNVHLMEDHDTAYDVWKAAKVRDRILVHFDGHLDFYWIADHSPEELLAARSRDEFHRMLVQVQAWNVGNLPLRKQVNIGNFIYPAVKEGIVRSFYWVVPDPFWATARVRLALLRSLEELIRQRPSEVGSLQATSWAIRLTVMGCPLAVCPLSALPSFREPVLLDIDTDYLLTVDCESPPPYFSRDDVTPWLSVTAFQRRLANAAIPADLVTIAYSVNGGYTPLAYKFYGDHIAEGLKAPQETLTDRPRGDTAAEAYTQVRNCLARGDKARAQEAWNVMVARDPSYRTVYANPAYRDEMAGNWSAALSGYEELVQWNPAWSVAHLGRGRALWRWGHLDEAEQAFSEARKLNPNSVAAACWLGHCALRRKDLETAEQEWRNAVAWNPQEPTIWLAWARLLARQRRTSEAVDAVRHCLRLGWNPRRVRRFLAKQMAQQHSKDSARRYDMATQESMDVCFERVPTIVTRQVAGEVILVPIQPRLKEDAALFTLDESAAFLWNQLDGRKNGWDLVKALLEVYDANMEQAQNDVERFLSQLQEIDAIRPVASSPA